VCAASRDGTFVPGSREKKYPGQDIGRLPSHGEHYKHSHGEHSFPSCRATQPGSEATQMSAMTNPNTIYGAPHIGVLFSTLCVYFSGYSLRLLNTIRPDSDDP
jgi:hypothetical protein